MVLMGCMMTFMKPKGLARLFSHNVKRLLDARGWSQGELSRRMKISAGVVSRMLSGEHAPSGATLATVAELLGVAPHELILPPSSDVLPSQSTGKSAL